MEVLRGLRPDTPAPDAVIVVVDASNLQRNLYLVSQLIELGRPMVVALNMMDVAERRGLDVSPELLAKELGVPVVPIVGHKRRGDRSFEGGDCQGGVAPLPDFQLPQAMKEELMRWGRGWRAGCGGGGSGFRKCAGSELKTGTDTVSQLQSATSSGASRFS